MMMKFLIQAKKHLSNKARAFAKQTLIYLFPIMIIMIMMVSQQS